MPRPSGSRTGWPVVVTSGLLDYNAIIACSVQVSKLALGEPTENIPTFGTNIHNDLAQRWLPILKKGLAKEVKEKLLKEHQVPVNCKLLKSPCLNPEISAAVAEVVRMHQDQAGVLFGKINAPMVFGEYVN
ncbi:hypothetical protein evm_004856 [Chilo suppressalis]|nr:hypothetical protein evm_004856 [Chilo suppressalis]